MKTWTLEVRMIDSKFIHTQILSIAREPWLGKAYRPVNIRIGNEAKALYAAEERRTFFVEKTADEWCRVTGFDPGKPSDKWYRAMPQTLYDTLDAFDTDAAEAAAVAFLEMRGYKIPRESWPEHRR